MYDSTVYYVKGVYDLYKKSDSTSQRDEELQEMYLSDRNCLQFITPELLVHKDRFYILGFYITIQFINIEK